MWSAAEQIKKRREALGLSQDAVAAKLSVSKSYISQIETARRPLTVGQAILLADLLEISADMLLVGSGKFPADVEDLLKRDVVTATTAVRSRTEQSPISYPREPANPPVAGRKRRGPMRAPAIPALIHVTKTTSSYRAHSYHTKVPPAAITPFIEAFTRPGDVVLDSFCGSGMTGVAARSLGRNSLLSDLSPAAVHIARNYNTYCDPEDLSRAIDRLALAVHPTMSWLYKPVGQGGQTVEYTTWSDVFECRRCSSEILYWDVVRDHGEMTRCPHCDTAMVKADLKWVGEVPVQTHVSEVGRRIVSHSPTEQELALIAEVSAAPIPHWTPSVPFGSDREMWRASHSAMGIKTAADFYTNRNLHALAAIRHSIALEPDSRLREALMFAFTACVNRASRRYQWNEKRPTNVMTGTLYISSLRYEWNAWSLFKRKASDVLRYYWGFAKGTSTSQVYERSATDLSCIPDGSVDMAFIDPPFGSNIFYADSSLLWDAWLGSATDQTQEIVVNQRRQGASGGKDIADYGSLLGQAFGELERVIRPGGQTGVAFSNSNDRVWEALQDAFSDAGFTVATVHILDKGQPSIKGVKGLLGKEFVTRLDLALSLERRKSGISPERSVATSAFIDASVRSSVQAGEFRPDHIYAAVLRDALQANLTVNGITMPEIERRRAEMASRGVDNGRPAASADLVSAYLSSSDGLPVSDNSGVVSKGPESRLVEGGRGSAFYLAHSYHTKVPPESIQPFIEHFTKPGDVVLDPFCGSGMTGVAASLLGRRSILNDLSPAAVHLAWNHTHVCDPKELSTAFEQIYAKLAGPFGALYATEDEYGRPATIRWTVWSTRHECPVCSNQFDLWETIDKADGRMGRATTCPKCLHEGDRRHFKVVSTAPVWVAFQRENGSLGEKAASSTDVDRATRVQMPPDLWHPNHALGADREMYLRCALHLQGIRTVADLYTSRNLKALAMLWQEILAVDDERIQKALAFAFTNTAWHGTRMRRFNARGGHRPMTGTLYVPQLSSEANVLEVMKNKIGQLRSYYDAFRPAGAVVPAITLGSATKLQGVEDASIDYVFTDPPFGSNIFYADCNLIWESWLGRVTDMTLEAVVNRSLSIAAGGKTLANYGDLMAQSMKEIVRVLKPGGWATVVFHNTDKDVWQAIRDAASEAGLEFHEASSLDRKQQSHKGYKGRSGAEDVAHFDVVMNLRKPAVKAKRGEATKERSLDLAALVKAARSIPEVAARGLQGVHAEVMRNLASLGANEFPDFSEVRALYEGR